MFIIHFSKTEACTLIDGGVLVVLLPIGNAVIRHKFHIDLYFLPRVFCTKIRLRLAAFPLLRRFIQLHSSDCTKHGLIAALVAFFTKPVPQHDHIIVVRIMPSDQLIFFCCLLIWAVVRAVGAFTQALPAAVISLLPPVDGHPADFVSDACCCYSVLSCIFYCRLTKPGFLCYTIHEGKHLFRYVFLWLLTS